MTPSQGHVVEIRVRRHAGESAMEGRGGITGLPDPLPLLAIASPCERTGGMQGRSGNTPATCQADPRRIPAHDPEAANLSLSRLSRAMTPDDVGRTY
jgi:hypothetical protein